MDKIIPSFLIASSNPKELAEFYALVCNGKVSKGFNSNHYLIIYRQNFKIQIYKPSSLSSPLYKGTSALSICFQNIPNIDPLMKLNQWCEEIILLGAKVVKEAKQESFGAEAWMKDQEGNKFLLLVPLKEGNDNELKKIS